MARFYIWPYTVNIQQYKLSDSHLTPNYQNSWHVGLSNIKVGSIKTLAAYSSKTQITWILTKMLIYINIVYKFNLVLIGLLYWPNKIWVELPKYSWIWQGNLLVQILSYILSKPYGRSGQKKTNWLINSHKVNIKSNFSRRNLL